MLNENNKEGDSVTLPFLKRTPISLKVLGISSNRLSTERIGKYIHIYIYILF